MNSKESFKFLVSSFKLQGEGNTRQPRTYLPKLETRNLKLQTYRLILLVATVMLTTAACRQQMADQPRYDPLEPSTFFTDGQSARPLVPGTVARGQLREDTHLHSGITGGVPANAFPFPITAEVLKRGQERYNIYCSPCHARTGTGDGMIVRRGFTRPASFHTDRLRDIPPGYFFNVITQGMGAMPDYRHQIPPYDRWAIIAYIRALQLSYNAAVTDVPPEKLQSLAEVPSQ